MIKVKRIYEPSEKDDGLRVLVDRLWPRGIRKDQSDTDLWLKEIAPTTELRQWFNHQEEKFDQFKQLYFKELDKNSDQIKLILDAAKRGTVTLLYAAKNKQANQAIVLKEFIEKLIDGKY